MSKINQENYERYERLVETVNRFAKSAGAEMSFTAVTDEIGKAIACVAIPEDTVISKPAMHELYKACFAADEMRMSAGQITFEVRGVFSVEEEE